MIQTWAARWTRFQGTRLARWGWLILLIASALVAVAAMLYLTRDGAGASGDSVHYMQGAENLLAGRGYSRWKADGSTVPITGFPPLFSMVLAVLSVFLPVFDAARYLNALLLGANVILIGLLTFRASRSGAYGLLAGWLLMYAESVVRIHAWVMSEPLFIFLSLLALWWLEDALTSRKWGVLVFAGLLAGAAALTRYAGLALIPAGCLLLFLAGTPKWPRRLGQAILFGFASMLPVVAWFWRNSIVTGSAANRAVGYHPMASELINNFIDQIAIYWLPPSLTFLWNYRLALTIGLALAGMGIYIAAWYRGRKASPQPVNPLPVLLAVYVVFYIVLLLVNTTFLDASTDEPGIRRYALPLLPMMVIWVFCTFPLLGRLIGKQNWVKLAVVAIGLGMTLYYANDSVSYLRHPNYSFGYTDARRFWECEVDAIRKIDPSLPALTNDYELFYFLSSGRVAYTLPKRYDHYQAKEVADYEEKMDAIKVLVHQKAVLVAFGAPDGYGEEVNGLIADENLSIWAECGQARFFVEP